MLIVMSKPPRSTAALSAIARRAQVFAAARPAYLDLLSECGPITTGDHRPIPFLRFWLGGEPASVGTVASNASPMGRMLLLPRRAWTTRRVYNQRAGTIPRVTVPEGYRMIYRNRSWRVLAAPGCVA